MSLNISEREKEGQGWVACGPGHHPLDRLSSTIVWSRTHWDEILVCCNTATQHSFKANLKHGDGVVVCEGSWLYRGQWRKDCRWGQGSCGYINGDEYVGEWQADKRHGKGCLKTRDGYCYDGEWLDDKQHGLGEYGHGCLLVLWMCVHRLLVGIA